MSFKSTIFVSELATLPIDIETLRMTETILTEIVHTKIVSETEAEIAETGDLLAETEIDILTISMTDRVVTEAKQHGSKTDRKPYRIITTPRLPIFSKATKPGTVF